MIDSILATDPVVLWLLFGAPLIFLAFGVVVILLHGRSDEPHQHHPGE
jgi:hypothetical protein